MAAAAGGGGEDSSLRDGEGRNVDTSSVQEDTASTSVANSTQFNSLTVDTQNAQQAEESDANESRSPTTIIPSSTVIHPLTSAASLNRKAPRLSKQIGVDDETQISFVVSEAPEAGRTDSEEQPTSPSAIAHPQKSEGNAEALDSPMMRATIAGLVPLMRQVPISRSDGNLRSTASLGSNPKGRPLVRSVALCADDDTRLRPPPDMVRSQPHLVLPHRHSSNKSSHSLSRDSSKSFDYTDDSGVELIPFFVATLHKNPKDRLMLLDLEQQLVTFIQDIDKKLCRLPAMSSYNRMLVHRTAAYFGLDHNVDQSGQSVVVTKTSNSRIPEISFRSMIRGNMFSEQRKCLRRDAQSYEEVRHMATPLTGSVGALDSQGWRRARSFEVGSEAAAAAAAANAAHLQNAGSGHRLTPSHALRIFGQHESNSSTEGTAMASYDSASYASSTEYTPTYPRDQRYVAYATAGGAHSAGGSLDPYGQNPQPGPYPQWSSCDSYSASMEVSNIVGMASPQGSLVGVQPTRPSVLPKADSFSSYRYEEKGSNNNGREPSVPEYPEESQPTPAQVPFVQTAYTEYPGVVIPPEAPYAVYTQGYTAYPAHLQAAQVAQVPAAPIQHYQPMVHPSGQTIFVPVAYQPGPPMMASPQSTYYPANVDIATREFAALSTTGDSSSTTSPVSVQRAPQVTTVPTTVSYMIPQMVSPQQASSQHPTAYYQYTMAPAGAGSPYFVPVPTTTATAGIYPVYHANPSGYMQHSPYPQASPGAIYYRPAAHVQQGYGSPEGSETSSSQDNRPPMTRPSGIAYEHGLVARNRSQDAGYGSMHQESMRESDEPNA